MASASEQSSAPAADPRPRSAVSAGVGMAGLVGLLLWAGIARATGMTGPLAALTALVACGLPMVLWSLLIDKVHRNPTTGIDWDSPPRPVRAVLDTSIVKLTGLWAVWGAIGCLYCVGRWYWANPYLFSMELFGYAVGPLAVLSVPYVIWLDRRLKESKDGAWHFGAWIIGRADAVDRELVFDFLRGWAIKGFFLAFMLAITPGNWADAVRPDMSAILADPVNLARWLITLMFMVDVILASVGYILTMKPLDAHIRSANPYASGWVAALICYPPFILMGPGGPLDYHRNTAEWTHWMADQPIALAVTGFVLVALTAIYAWATIAFGLRFSNLTHRGVLTHGPYAISKHPAYLAKNLFWWIAVLPFLATSGSMVDAIRNTAILGLVSGVYFWRAKTEEKHLSADPAYRDYAAWMERNGAVPRFLRWLVNAPPPPSRAATPQPAE